MKRFIKSARCLIVALSLTAFAESVFAQLVIPGADGSDGALSMTQCNQTRVIDLSQAAIGTWDSPGNGNGVYDPAKWVVVFKYSSVLIGTGNCDIGIRFINHLSRAPVVWLVSGNVTIHTRATLELSGGITSSTTYAEPGPGGFRGGAGAQSSSLRNGGFGSGGGSTSAQSAGSYATQGTNNPGPTYGNARILPLIGGSGGGGGNTNTTGGGAGGGAILIAATGTITINGLIRANGQSMSFSSAGPGSGGAVRLIADTVTGTSSGRIEAVGGLNTFSSSIDSTGGNGRIRIEANSFTGSIATIPSTSAVLPDDPVLLWPPDTAPTIRIVSVGNATAPVDPRALLSGTDIALNGVTAGDIVLETTNVEPNATVIVRITPGSGPPSTVNATLTTGTRELATWTASGVTLPSDAFVVQARAENPPPAAQ